MLCSQMPRRVRKTRIQLAVSSLQTYMAKYDEQPGYQHYSDETFINDVLYGLGIALDPSKFQYADGFDKFKERLRAHLAEATPHRTTERSSMEG